VKSIRRPTITVISVLLALGCALGCASTSGSWEKAREQDTAGAYHRFLRDNPRSPYAEEAKQRLAFSRLAKKPTAEGYAAFRESYPNSPLVEEIRPLVEDGVFDRVRSRGTVTAYREFMTEFPGSPHSDRAAGNAEYLENHGFSGRPSELAAFAERHPTSDFAAEARHSVKLAKVRQQQPIRTIGLVLAVDPNTPGAPRLSRSLAQRAQRHYAKAKIQVVALSGADDPRAAKVDALLTIEHDEGAVQAEMSVGRSFSPGIVATTKFTLARPGESTPIRSDEFRHKVTNSERKDGESIVFGVAGSRYWDGLFFPDATWSNQLATRAAFDVKKPGVAVEAIDHRAIVLFEDGSFEIVDFSDPAAPRVVSRYTRPKDLTSWSDVRSIDGRIVIFGGDGLEVVEVTGDGPKKILRLDRAAIGSIVAVEDAGDDILLAGSRGLMLLERGSNQPRMLVEKGIRGAALNRGRVYFTDGSSLFTSTLPKLMSQKADGELRIGEKFAPGRIRVWGKTAVVMGKEDVLLVDVGNPSALRIQSRVTTVARGEIRDAIALRGQLYVLSDRGLLVSNAADARTRDAVGVAARTRMVRAGRHLVIVGDESLQVVDTTPFSVGSSPARARR
jgi:hypothetical protein